MYKCKLKVLVFVLDTCSFKFGCFDLELVCFCFGYLGVLIGNLCYSNLSVMKFTLFYYFSLLSNKNFKVGKNPKELIKFHIGDSDTHELMLISWPR